MSELQRGPDTASGLKDAVQIDEICDRFESAWKAGDRPEIGDYLVDTRPAIATMLFVELLRIDLEYRCRSGEEVTVADYVTRYPQFKAVISRLRQEIDVETTAQLPRPSDRIRQYELSQMVGQGSFGTVWRAWDEKLQRTVAIKIQRQQFGGRLTANLFLREARAAARLDHPGIVRVFDFGDEAGQGYIVFEFIHGVTLKNWLGGQVIDSKEAARMAADIADALEHAHAAGVVHRDLKPGNILIDGEGKPRITDFGLARRLDHHSTIATPGKLLGTLVYMSPEQASADGSPVDARSDVYSLGVILYQMLAGRVPFRGETTVVVHQILSVEPASLRKLNCKVPRDLETICRKALAKRPEDRYQSAAEMRDDLRRFLNHEPIRARRTPLPVRSWRWIQRNRLLAASMLMALSATLGAAAFAILNPPPPDDRRLISITSRPEGARVAFVPLNELSGAPEPENIIHSGDVTPLKERLSPGDYLVVAYLDDGRFHEVYRHVPYPDETLIGPFRHRQWFTDDNDDRVTRLPAVTIPDLSITDGMALIEGTTNFIAGDANSTITPAHVRSVPDFYIDATEVTLGDYKRVHRGESPYHSRIQVPTDQHALRVNWDWAVDTAERLGKRLPHEIEFEYVATNRGLSDFPWGTADQIPHTPETEFDIVGQPAFDQLPTKPPVFGLCSNVAEWTMNRRSDYYPTSRTSPAIARHHRGLHDERVIRGGSIQTVEGDPAVTPDSRNPRRRDAAVYFRVDPGLGLRCVRSTKLRLKPDDFVRNRAH